MLPAACPVHICRPVQVSVVLSRSSCQTEIAHTRPQRFELQIGLPTSAGSQHSLIALELRR